MTNLSFHFLREKKLTDGFYQKLNSLVENNIKLMDEYEVTKAARAISDFTIDHLSTW